MAEPEGMRGWRGAGCLVVPLAALVAFVTFGALAAAVGAGAGLSGVIGLVGAVAGTLLVVRGLHRGAFEG